MSANLSQNCHRITRESLENIIAFYEAARERPAVYFQPSIPEAIDCILSYFNQALYFVNIKESSRYQREIAIERGWEYNALGAVPSMREKGLKDEEMITELLTFEIEHWKRVLENLEK